MRYLQYGLLSTNHSGKLIDYLGTNTTEPLPTTTCTLQTTDWRHQQDRQTINKTNFTNNKLTDIWLTKDGSKSTNHVLQSSQSITSRLNWQTSSNIVISSDQSGEQTETYHIDLLTNNNSVNCDDDFRPGYRNVSQCHHKQSFWGLHWPERSYFTD